MATPPLLIDSFAPGDFVAGHDAVFFDGDRFGGQRGEVAPGLGFGGPIGHEQGFIGDAPEPDGFLVIGAPHVQRVSAEEGGEHARRDAEVNGGHQFGDAVDADVVIAQTAGSLGD